MVGWGHFQNQFKIQGGTGLTLMSKLDIFIIISCIFLFYMGEY